MIIATWNINGIKARLDRLVLWLQTHHPDVLCLQEIKTEDARFPAEPFASLGYELVTHGQKSYNGVAILSLHPITSVTRGIPDDVDDPQARLIAVDTAGVRVMSAYFPNGQAVGADKYVYKLAWMARLRAHLEAERLHERPCVLCGDFNVAPDPRDTHDPSVWEGGILCSDAEREALSLIGALGFVDALRRLRPDDIVFTWWDYRALGFPKNHGLRIDHFYVSSTIATRLESVQVDREARKGQQPSDHAPVLMALRDDG